MPDTLEQLDLLLIQVAKARQVRVDGIHFQSMRDISTMLAANAGEAVTLCFDPGTWRKSASSTRTGFYAGPSVRNWLVPPFLFEKFSVPATGNGANCARSFGTGRPPSIERVLEVNLLREVTKAVVEAAREAS